MDNTVATSHVDQEHAVQLEMLDLLSLAIRDNKPEADKLEILDQLISYTEIHFMSEQLIMRERSYEGLDEHEADHDALMERLLEIKTDCLSNGVNADNRGIQSLRSLLLTHIATQDRKLSTFLKTPQPGTGQ